MKGVGEGEKGMDIIILMCENFKENWKLKNSISWPLSPHMLIPKVCAWYQPAYIWFWCSYGWSPSDRQQWGGEGGKVSKRPPSAEDWGTRERLWPSCSIPFSLSHRTEAVKLSCHMLPWPWDSASQRAWKQEAKWSRTRSLEPTKQNKAFLL